MSSEIFNDIVAGATVQGQPTASQKRKQLVEQLTQASVQLPVGIVQSLNQSLGSFWSADDPQRLADELDKKNGVGYTKALFILHAELAAFVGAKVPALASAIQGKPKNYNVEFNGDSVVITEIEE